jgi:hypothetical protein
MSKIAQEPENMVKTTISMPEDLLEAGKARAKSQRRAFSAHLQYLLENDIKGAVPAEPAQEVGS